MKLVVLFLLLLLFKTKPVWFDFLEARESQRAAYFCVIYVSEWDFDCEPILLLVESVRFFFWFSCGITMLTCVVVQWRKSTITRMN